MCKQIKTLPKNNLFNKLFRKLFSSKEKRKYLKMHREHRKELVKLAKRTYEYDWCWLHEMILMQIKHMYEYYSAGNNVWQVDESRFMIIEELKHVLDLQKEIEFAEMDATLESVDKEQELYEEFYNSIGKNIRKWWD